MTTWLASGPISHPWFRQPSGKRKLSGDDSSGSSTSRSNSPSPPPPKRPKQTLLEAGLSSLSLINTEPDVLHHIAEPEPTDYSPMEVTPVVLPSAVEEPVIREVKMKSSSWYEPEPDRIVITNLDSSDEEDEGEEGPDTSTLSISPALLKKLSSRSTRDLGVPLMTAPKNESQALILFKPLPVPGLGGEETEENDERLDKIKDVIKDDDAMDVEP